jgi:hypothetical protein
MAIFRHPHLTRGIVHTPHGAFAINRGFADLPEDVGEALGWRRVEDSPFPGSPGLEAIPLAVPSRDQLDAR